MSEMTREHLEAQNRSITVLFTMAGDKAQHATFRQQCKRDAKRLSEVAAMIEAMVSERERLQPIAKLTDAAMTGEKP